MLRVTTTPKTMPRIRTNHAPTRHHGQLVAEFVHLGGVLAKGFVLGFRQGVQPLLDVRGETLQFTAVDRVTLGLHDLGRVVVAAEIRSNSMMYVKHAQTVHLLPQGVTCQERWGPACPWLSRRPSA